MVMNLMTIFYLTTKAMLLINTPMELINSRLMAFSSFHINFLLRRSVLRQEKINGGVGET